VATTFERGRKKRCDNFLSEPDAHHTRTDRQNIGVVVGSSHSGRVQVVAQSSSHAAHLVGSELLTLTATPENDAEVRTPVTHHSADAGTDGRVVATLRRVRSLIVDFVPCSTQERHKMLLQVVARMIRSDSDAQVRHARSLRL
jgi:hypothetical protein